MNASVLCLANNSCINTSFENLKIKFHRLYKRKANVHHYTEYMDIGEFDKASQSLDDLIQRYNECEKKKDEITRIAPLL